MSTLLQELCHRRFSEIAQNFSESLLDCFRFHQKLVCYLLYVYVFQYALMKTYDLEIKKFWNKFGKRCGIIFWKIFLFGYGWWRKLLVKGFLKLWRCQIIWLLFAGFKTIIFCLVHTIWFMKYVFPVKIWFVKTWIRIMKYKSHVIKSSLILSTPFLLEGEA